MPYKLVDINETLIGIGDIVPNGLLGECTITNVELPRPVGPPGSFGFPGRITVRNSNGNTELFYPSEVGLTFIEDQ